MKKNKFPTCPYCGRRLNFARAWSIHSKTEYTCPNCSYVSEVKLEDKMQKNAIVAVIISIILILIFSIVNTIKIWEILIAVIPFVIFYITVPQNLLLEKTPQSDKRFFDEAIKDERKRNRQIKKSNTDVLEKIRKSELEDNEDLSEKTIVISDIKEDVKEISKIDDIKLDDLDLDDTNMVDNISFTSLFNDLPNEKD